MDSVANPWSVWCRKKFPNATDMIQKLHGQGVKVICWATSMVNTDSPNYQEGKDKGYYLNHGATIKWWHGHGSFIDYSNPDAVDWWHKQMDIPLNDGIDGWKTDGTDPFVFELLIPRGHKGIISEREYADWYYRDFFYYTRQKRGPEALIMARPVDSYKMLHWSFAPRDVVFSGWVGDQDPTFDGLQKALSNMFQSSWKGYVGFGSDIGGYRSGERTRALFVRWFQVGAFCALMENGGNNEHRPWMYDQQYGTGNETVDTYRKFTHAHHELIPYMMSAGMDAWNNNHSIMTPIAKESIFTPTIWDYMFGKDIFVAPLINNSTTRTIHFPAGNDWVDYWDSSMLYHGGSTVKDLPAPLTTLPVFKRAGSIIPLHVSRSYIGHGDESSEGHITLLIERPKGSERKTIYSFSSKSFEARYKVESGKMLISVSAQPQPLIILVRGIATEQLTVTQRTISGIMQLNKELKVTPSEVYIKLSQNAVEAGVELMLSGLQ